MKAIFKGLIILLAVAMAGPAMAVDFAFHGDLNNRFMVYTDQADWFSADTNGTTAKTDSADSWGEIKYRLWAEASTNEGAIKGVYGIELGAVRFGRNGGGKSQGGAFSGDGVNIETRWAYTDLAIPDSAARVRAGLQPISVNDFFWNETAMGLVYSNGGLNLSWARGSEAVTTTGQNWGDSDLDALIASYELKQDALSANLFGVYLTQGLSAAFADYSAFNTLTGYEIKNLPATEFGIAVIGVDGSYKIPSDLGEVFLSWDGLYENGTLNDVSIDAGATRNDLDLSAYLLHLDAGIKLGKTKLTYTTWYASGDDNATDTDLDGFISVDVDRFDSIIFMEGGYTDDNYFTERPYIGDKGLFFNKLAVDHSASDKLTFGGALLYLQTAEDLTYIDNNSNAQAQNSLGVEVDGYVSYKLYPNCEVALNAGYLFAGDAMDFFEAAAEQDGSADNDVFRSTARIRYKF
jgi:hypothetical protein